MHFDGTLEDVQIERLNLLTREFQLRLRREQGYNIVAVHVAVRRNVQSASVPLKKRAFLVNVTLLSHILTKLATCHVSGIAQCLTIARKLSACHGTLERAIDTLN